MLGHEWAVNLLREHVARNQVRHAYLLTGPAGVGRRTLALRLTQALNCLEPTQPGEPCGQCLACKRIETMQYPDLAVVQAEQVGGTLKIDQVRELQHTLALAPYEGRYRVALLLRFEEAHPGAANALLKTLEEPPPQVVLALTAESPESLLPTIISRCEVLRLRPLSSELTADGLQSLWGLDADMARLLAHVSGGRPGYALQLHRHAELMEQRQVWLDDLVSLLSAARVERFAYARKLAEQKEDLRQVLFVWLSFWRDLAMYAAGASLAPVNLDWSEVLKDLAGRLEPDVARSMVRALEQTLDLIGRNVNTRLALEVFMLDMPRIRKGASA
ncbi:MAG: hypothetical protein JW726_06950 [Anaerolineales bacterium]|nr:hypothetical protein [Anaerolineales bacterium]